MPPGKVRLQWQLPAASLLAAAQGATHLARTQWQPQSAILAEALPPAVALQEGEGDANSIIQKTMGIGFHTRLTNEESHETIEVGFWCTNTVRALGWCA